MMKKFLALLLTVMMVTCMLMAVAEPAEVQLPQAVQTQAPSVEEIDKSELDANVVG